MAWYHWIPGVGLTILAGEKIVEAVKNDAVQTKAISETDERQQITKEIELYISGLPTAQQPTEWFKDSSGKWVLKFANGATVDFDTYKGLSNTERFNLALNINDTGGTGNKSNTGTGNSGKSSGTSTTTILLGIGVVLAFGLVLFLLFRNRGNSSKKK